MHGIVAASLHRLPTYSSLHDLLDDLPTSADGTITVPAVALAMKNRSASVVIMKSFDHGEQLLSNSGDLIDPESSAFGYEVMVAETGTAYLTANITTWHMNQPVRNYKYNKDAAGRPCVLHCWLLEPDTAHRG